VQPDVAFQELPFIYRCVDPQHFPLSPLAVKSAFDTRHIALLSGESCILAKQADSARVLSTLLGIIADVKDFHLYSKRMFYELTAPEIPQATRVYLEAPTPALEKTATVFQQLRQHSCVFLKPVSGQEAHDGRGVHRLTLLENTTIEVEALSAHDWTLQTRRLPFNEVERILLALFSSPVPYSFAIEPPLPYPRIDSRAWEMRFVLHKPTSSEEPVFLQSITRLSEPNGRTVIQAPFFADTASVLNAMRHRASPELPADEIARFTESTIGHCVALTQRCATLYANALADAVEFALGQRPPQLLCTPSEFMADIVLCPTLNSQGELKPHLMEIQLSGGLTMFAKMHPGPHARLVESRTAQQATGIWEVIEWLKRLPGDLPRLGRLTEICIQARQGSGSLAHEALA
jgi:hypothetical protein